MPLSKQTKHNKCGRCFQRRMSAVWERSHVRKFWGQLYWNTLMTDFARPFRNDHNNISAFQHFNRNQHFHNNMCLFRTRQKPPQVKIKKILWIKLFFFTEFANSITHFSCDTSKCALKQGDGNSYWFIYSADSLTKHSNCTLYHLCQINSTGRLKKECLSSMIIFPP